MTPPKAVFLDIGWTLVYPRESMWGSFAAVSAAEGATVAELEAETYVHGLMAARRHAAIEDLESGAEYPDSDTAFREVFLSMGRLLFGRAGLNHDLDSLTERFLQRFWDTENWRIFPDVIPALERLRADGVRVGAVSNASSEILDFLEAIGLIGHLDFALVSAVEGVKKPDPRIFRKALASAGVAPEEAVHVGDMYLEDVLGAGKACVRSLLMDRTPHGMFPNHPESRNHDPGSVRIVRSLDEVLAAEGLG